MSDESRKRFEKWAKTCGYKLDMRIATMEYREENTAHAWGGWRTAEKAATAAQQEAVKPLVDALIEATAYMSPRYAGVADIGYNQAVEIVNKALAAYQAQAGEE